MFCNKCGAQLEDDARFCPNCGAEAAATGEAVTPQPSTQDEAQPQLPVETPPPAKKKKKKGLKIVLACVGVLALIAAILAVVFYVKYWPGEFTSEQLSEIKSNAEKRMETALDNFGFSDIDVVVSIRDEVEKELIGDENPLWYERVYHVDYKLTTHGDLDETGKACIVMVMDWLWGGEVKLEGEVVNQCERNDLYESHTVRYEWRAEEESYFMGVHIPATDYSWSAHTSFNIDGTDYYGETYYDDYQVRVNGKTHSITELLSYMGGKQ